MLVRVGRCQGRGKWIESFILRQNKHTLMMMNFQSLRDHVVQSTHNRSRHAFILNGDISKCFEMSGMYACLIVHFIIKYRSLRIIFRAFLPSEI